MKAKQIRVHPDMNDLLDDFHKKITAVVPNISRPVSSGILAKSLRESDLLNRIDIIKIKEPRGRRNFFDLRIEI